MCFSLNSDMSREIIASSSPKRNSASAFESSVLPTPDGPAKMNEPPGRFGSFRPARVRRMARERPMTASFWPMTRLWSSSSMRSRREDSSSVSLKTGMPVAVARTSAISSPSTSATTSMSPAFHSFSRLAFAARSCFSLSRSEAAFSKSCAVGGGPAGAADTGGLRVERRWRCRRRRVVRRRMGVRGRGRWSDAASDGALVAAGSGRRSYRSDRVAAGVGRDLAGSRGPRCRRPDDRTPSPGVERIRRAGRLGVAAGARAGSRGRVLASGTAVRAVGRCGRPLPGASRGRRRGGVPSGAAAECPYPRGGLSSGRLSGSRPRRPP
ncbi:hypothetical protein STANM309S_02083 [Streptomyces tanashiensis]